jgi:hypothetical protein
MGRGWLVRGRSIGGSRVRAHAEGAFARGNDWYAVEAPAHALLARLCERAGLRRARPCGVASVERERCVEKKKPKKNVDLYVQTVSSSEQGFVVVCA